MPIKRNRFLIGAIIIFTAAVGLGIYLVNKPAAPAENMEEKEILEEFILTPEEINPISACHISIEEFTSREKPEYYVFEGIAQKKIILNAIEEIKENSKMDYNMICRYGNKILVRPDEIILKKCAPQGTPSSACYSHKERAIYLSYHSLLDEEKLPALLVHEAYHRMELEKTGDTSEKSCRKREELYNASSEKKSFYCERKAATTSYSINEGTTWRINGICTFINNENKDRTICINVYLKDAGRIVNQIELCSYTIAAKISEEEFFISGQTKNYSLEYKEIKD